MASIPSQEPAGYAPGAASATGLSRWFGLLLVMALGAAAVAIGWTGYIASDDASYYGGAVEWLRNAPFAGDSHWTTRFPVVLSLAGAMLLVGAGPAALALTSLFWFVSFVATGAALAARIGDRRVGRLAAVLLATLPLSAVSASIVNCDLPEATFLMLGLWLLARVVQRDGQGRHAAAAGICFGLAILCRETAVLALAGFAPLFLAGRPVPRRVLLVAGAGAAAVLALEMLFQFAVTGDPLHRYMLAFNHDDTLSRAANLEGNLLVHPLVDPLLVLLVNNEFGLLFWVAAAALCAGAVRGVRPSGKNALVLCIALGLASALLVSLLSTKLVLNPRYFTMTAIAAAVIAALWVSRLKALQAALVMTGVVGLNFLLLSVQNNNPQWPAYALVEAALEHPGRAIAADEEIVHRAELPLGWSGADNVVFAGEAASLRLIEQSADAPPAIAVYPSPTTRLGSILRALGLSDSLPAAVEPRLMRPNPTMIVVEANTTPK